MNCSPEINDVMSNVNIGAHVSWKGCWQGVQAMANFIIFVGIFGIAFGVASGEAGLSLSQSVMMSALVFAGTAQMAVLEFWGAAVPLLPLVMVTFAVNVRHLPMGASLYPWLRHLSWPKRMMAMASLSDMNWAVSIDAYGKGERDVGVLIGGGVVMWATWLIGTMIGGMFGEFMHDPKAFGLDVLMLSFVTVILIGSWQGKASLLPWGVAGLATFLAYIWLPDNWHVITGALAGGITGGFVGNSAEEDCPDV